MVISLSPERTVLWDQIRYGGDPEDFVWVLPVPSSRVTIELAESASFDEMESGTAPRVRPEPVSGGGGGVGCGGSAADSAGGPPDDGVIVYDESVVGPYETVTIGSEDPEALYTWLTTRDYQITDETAATMDEYIDQGSIFVVLRLAPEQGTDAMQPVRITYPGYMATFPLKMVTVGARSTLGLSLWVISEQRYEAYNYENVQVDEGDLVYDWNDASSNYDDAFNLALDRAGGRAWVTEYAGGVPWLPTGQAEMDVVRQDIPYPFVTRLRTDMRVEYLTEDLILVPAMDSSPVDSSLTAGTELGRPASASNDGCQAGSLGRMNTLAFASLAAFLALARRRRRRGAQTAS